MKELRFRAEFSPSGFFGLGTRPDADDLRSGKPVIDEIVNGVELLHRIARPEVNEGLQRFRDSFVERYEQEEVPLLQALDEDDGLQFPAGAEADATPFCHPVLLRKLAEALQRGAHEIRLSPHDIALLESKSPLPLPDAFAVRASVAAASEGVMAGGDFRISLESVSGPSSAQLLGRLCQADERLHELIERQLRAEEALHPEAVFGEIVHLSEAGAARTYWSRLETAASSYAQGHCKKK